MTDRIVTAYAGPCSGPGWANRPVWVIRRDSNGRLYEQCIQPKEQSGEMRDIYDICAASNAAMVRAVDQWDRRDDE